MPVIEPKKPETHSSIKVKINDEVLTKINQYCQFANFENDDLSDFFESAANFVLNKDKDFQKHLKQKIAII